MIWAPFVMPKHSMIAWMTMINRLPTKDRLKSWGMAVDGTCVLCKQEEESRDHLFFECLFSQKLWHEISDLLWSLNRGFELERGGYVGHKEVEGKGFDCLGA